MIETSILGGLVFGGLAALLLILAAARRILARRRRRSAAGSGAGTGAGTAVGPAADPLLRRLEIRLDEIEAQIEAQAEAHGAPEERLQAMAGSLVGLIRDKNAAMETALAGLDQLRARMRALEQMGDPAEARRLFEQLGERVDALQAAHGAQGAALEERIAALKAQSEAGPQAALAEQFGRLYAQKDAGLAAMLARLGEIETARAAELPGRETLAALEARIEAMRAAQEEGQAAIAALRAERAGGPLAELGQRLAALHAQKDALAETLLARIGTVEEGLVRREAALDRLAERLEAAQEAQEAGAAALGGRLAALEAPGENPFAGIADQLTRLYAQKDATAEAVFARLAPLEIRLAGFAADLGQALPRLAVLEAGEPLAALEERLAALQAEMTAETALLRDLLGAAAAGPAATISDQLARLYDQRDAAAEAVSARLAALDAGLAARASQAALDRFAERLEAVQEAHAASEGALRDRLAALEHPGENPFAGIADQLARLYAQKDATVETVFARLAPLEARLSEIEAGLAAQDPQAALDRFAERLEAVQGRLAALEAPGEHPFAEISDQLARLYAQKDATVETVFARLAPLEARLAEIEAGLAAQDPQAALDRFAERLEAAQAAQAASEGALRDRLAALEHPGEHPFAEIADQLTRLYAQKDATVETVFARLAPLETRLAALEDGLAAQDPQAALDRFAERLEAVQEAHAASEGALRDRLAALEHPGENPFAGIADQLTRLYAQKDATVETVFARLAPLEARLAELAADLGLALPRLATLEAGAPLAALDGRIAALRQEAETQIAALKAALGEAVTARPLATIADQMARLYDQKDAALAALEARLAARLGALEVGLDARGESEASAAADAARAEAEAIATELLAVRAAAQRSAEETAQQTALFANRLALVEASLPQLSAAQAELMQAMERRAAPAPAVPAPAAPISAPVSAPVSGPAAASAARAAPDAATSREADQEEASRAADLEALQQLPRVVSLHQK